MPKNRVTTSNTPPPAWLKLPEVCRRTGLSKSSVYAKCKIGLLPKPAKLGLEPGARASGWCVEEIEAYVAQIKLARDPKGGASHV